MNVIKICKIFCARSKILKALIRLKKLGIAFDADGKPQNTFRSICSALGNTGLPVPRKRGNFTNPSQGSPCPGVYLFPDNEQSGMLEDPILRSLEKHSLIGCIEKFLDFVKSENFSLKIPQNRGSMLLLSFNRSSIGWERLLSADILTCRTVLLSQ